MYCIFLILIVLILVINYTFRILCRQIATELFQIIFKIVAMFYYEVVL